MAAAGPRDYLSTFLKIGTIVGLAIGILVVARICDTGAHPVCRWFWPGGRAICSPSCSSPSPAARSGFHALISGTTPKLLENESHMPYIGYGGMLMESFVAIMALIAASVIGLACIL